MGSVMMILFLKGGSGSGWYGPPTGTHLPSSADIETEDDARLYWLGNLGGKRITLTVHRKAGQFDVVVRFDARQDHAYTKANDRHDKDRGRAFSVRRAKLMDKILRAISSPDVILTNHGKDLFFEKIDDGDHYCVVLRWKDSSKEYEFESAHPWTASELREARKTLIASPVRGKKKAPMSKSIGAFNSAFPVFELSGSGALGDPGGVHAGSGWRDNVTLSSLLLEIQQRNSACMPYRCWS